MPLMNLPFRSYSLAAALVAVAAIPACATSNARVEKARTSAYQTDYPVVWKAVVDATHSEGYDRLKVEDAANGVVVSDWHKIERVADSQATDPHVRGGMDSSGAIFFRVSVKIEGKQPPYAIVVDGEAARYRPGYSSLFPYKHGSDDEPEWVPGRINALYVAVLNQLEPFAVAPGAVQGAPPRHALPAEGPGPVGPEGQPAQRGAPVQPVDSPPPPPNDTPAPVTP